MIFYEDHKKSLTMSLLEKEMQVRALLLGIYRHL